MKRRWFISAAIAVSFYSASVAATIESVSGGGAWGDTLTWVGYKVPGENDDVTIKGTVSVTSLAACRNLTVSESSVLQNGGDLGWVVLSVKGAAVNNGTIRNNPEKNELWITFYGDVTNNGKWAPAKTCFGSDKAQRISQAAGVEFNGLLQKKNTDGYADTFPLIAASDIVVNGSKFDCMGYKDKYFWGVLNMDGHTLTLKSATILVNAVMKNTSSLLGKDSSMVQSLSVDNPITLAGCVTLIDGNVTFNGDVTVADTLQNGGSLGWLTPKFMAKLTNNGVIRNNPRGNELWMDLYGDIVNNGKWAPAKTCFGSGKAQRISQAQNVEFNGLLQKKTADGSADTLPLIAASDLVINASRFDAQGYKSSYFWGVVDMDGHILTLKGPTLLVNAVMKNVKTLAFRDSSALQSASFDSAVNLAGHATLIDGNVTFNGEVTVADTLQNGGSLGWLTPKFKSKLINNGVIRNNPKGNELWVDLYGDVVNNGKWVLAKTCFASDKRQRIGQAENVEFGGLLQKKTSDGNADTFPLVATSDIVINAGRFDAQGYKSGYFWGVVDMAGHALTLKGPTLLVNAAMKNVKTLTCRDSSALQSTAFTDAVTLAGRVSVVDANVSFNGIVTIADTLQNGGSSGWLTIPANKGIVNNGTIRNNPAGNQLWLAIKGDVFNNGTWTNAQNTLLDSLDQSVSLIGDKPITARFIFDATWAGGPYQWQKNNTAWGGAGKTATLDTISSSSFGIYRCKKNDTLSRSITIRHGESTPIVREPGFAARNAEIPFGWNILSSKRLEFRIQTPAACGFSLSLFDMEGRRLAHSAGNVERGNHSFSLAQPVPGIYLVRFKSGKTLDSRKITITR